jgi:hypothetical protein
MGFSGEQNRGRDAQHHSDGAQGSLLILGIARHNDKPSHPHHSQTPSGLAFSLSSATAHVETLR